MCWLQLCLSMPAPSLNVANSGHVWTSNTDRPPFILLLAAAPDTAQKLVSRLSDSGYFPHLVMLVMAPVSCCNSTAGRALGLSLLPLPPPNTGGGGGGYAGWHIFPSHFASSSTSLAQHLTSPLSVQAHLTSSACLCECISGFTGKLCNLTENR